jgi:Nucleotide modification associated domain 2
MSWITTTVTLPTLISDTAHSATANIGNPGGGNKNVVELAEEHDWIVGTGGADLRKSAGNGKILYAMEITNKMSLHDYFNSPEFASKKLGSKGDYRFGDNHEPQTEFDKYERYVLISEHFYYFGRNAITIPEKRFPHFEKKGRGFRSDFDETYIARFAKWIAQGRRVGKLGDPCLPLGEEKIECDPCPKRTVRVCPVC